MAKTKLFELQCGSVKAPVASPANGAREIKRRDSFLRPKARDSRGQRGCQYTPKSISRRLALQAIARKKSLSSSDKYLCDYRGSSSDDTASVSGMHLSGRVSIVAMKWLTTMERRETEY